MKRIILAAAVFVIFSTTAQSVNNPLQPSGATRVAVVNVGHIFNHYEKAIRLKSEIDALLQPAKEKATHIIESMKIMEAAIARKDFAEASKEDYEEKLKFAKRKLEDLDVKMRKEVGKKQEENLVVLWKDAQDGIRQYATKQGIHLVLGYGDPIQKEVLDLFPNLNRKMQAMDLGSVSPLYIEPRAEIAHAVTEMLNRRYRAEMAKESE